MAENLPHGTNGAADNTRGLPYYEKLKRDLRETIQKKRLIDKSLSQIDEQIFKIEGAYLEETAAGNIIKGFDSYIKGSSALGSNSATGGGTSSRRKGTVMEHDRVFSRSSASYMQEISPQSSTQTTPSHAPTPTLANMQAQSRDSNHPTPTGTSHTKGTNNKKHKKGADKDDEDNDGKPPKRIKITYARGEKGSD